MVTQLRKKYLHGPQANVDGEDAHPNTNITALRLSGALVIKMNVTKSRGVELVVAAFRFPSP